VATIMAFISGLFAGGVVVLLLIPITDVQSFIQAYKLGLRDATSAAMCGDGEDDGDS